MTSLGALKVIDHRARKTRRVIRCQKGAASARDRALRPLALLHVRIRGKCPYRAVAAERACKYHDDILEERAR